MSFVSGHQTNLEDQHLFEKKMLKKHPASQFEISFFVGDGSKLDFLPEQNQTVITE
jgi:hypothetical protein